MGGELIHEVIVVGQADAEVLSELSAVEAVPGILRARDVGLTVDGARVPNAARYVGSESCGVGVIEGKIVRIDDRDRIDRRVELRHSFDVGNVDEGSCYEAMAWACDLARIGLGRIRDESTSLRAVDELLVRGDQIRLLA